MGITKKSDTAKSEVIILNVRSLPDEELLKSSDELSVALDDPNTDSSSNLSKENLVNTIARVFNKHVAKATLFSGEKMILKSAESLKKIG